MKIYLIGGKAGSGKSEVAKLIKNYYLAHNKRAIITEYSKYLKMYAKEILDWHETDAKPRKFLQDLGVTIRDNMDMPHMLINRLKEDLKVYNLYFDAVILSDVRYPDEITEIKKDYSTASSIYVINQFKESSLSLDEQMHITETALESFSDFDYTITNDDKENLENKVLNILEGENNES